MKRLYTGRAAPGYTHSVFKRWKKCHRHWKGCLMMRATALLTLLLLTSASAAQTPPNAAVPYLLNYQGKLVDSNNDPLDGEYDLAFHIYDGDAVSSQELWGPQEFADVPVSNGYFNIALGPADESTPTPRSLRAAFLDDDTYEDARYLQITMLSPSGDVVLDRQQILSAPYAMRAEDEAPPGTIVMFCGRTAQVPDGWLACEGQAVDIADYPDLYEAIGTYWGDGGATHDFNLPDLRGRYLRGVNGTRGASGDPDAATRTAQGTGAPEQVGSLQEDQLGEHRHRVPEHTHDHGDLTALLTFGTSSYYSQDDETLPWESVLRLSGFSLQTSTLAIHTTLGVDIRGSTYPNNPWTGYGVSNMNGDFRPVSFQVLHIIKY